jgi:hypothetical protein
MSVCEVCAAPELTAMACAEAVNHFVHSARSAAATPSQFDAAEAVDALRVEFRWPQQASRRDSTASCAPRASSEELVSASRVECGGDAVGEDSTVAGDLDEVDELGSTSPTSEQAHVELDDMAEIGTLIGLSDIGGVILANTMSHRPPLWHNLRRMWGSPKY